MTAAVDVRRAAERFVTRTDWLESRHSFSSGRHYDPANTSHGVLLVNDDHVVAPGHGFATHAHRDTEIVTWVLHGSLVHEDSTGHRGVLRPGLAQRMSAGTGVVHAERNDGSEPVRFVQMWVLPDEPGGEPGYEQRDVEDDLRRGGLVTVASGMPGHGSAIRLRNRSAALHAARLQPSEEVELPDAPHVHLFVARGEAVLDGAGPLAEGDAVRLTAAGARRLTAASAAEVLVWEMHAG